MTTGNGIDVMDTQWVKVCEYADLLLNAGVGVRLGDAQVALFLLPPSPTDTEERLFAVDNHDPFSNANVIARGIVGDVAGEPVVASPLYKQHFRLSDGSCVEDASVVLRCWEVRRTGEAIEITDLG